MHRKKKTMICNSQTCHLKNVGCIKKITKNSKTRKISEFFQALDSENSFVKMLRVWQLNIFSGDIQPPELKYVKNQMAMPYQALSHCFAPFFHSKQNYRNYKGSVLTGCFQKMCSKKNSSTQLVCTLYLIYLSVDKDASRATTCHRLNIIGPMETANHS